MDDVTILAISNQLYCKLVVNDLLKEKFKNVSPDRYNMMMFHVFSVILDRDGHEIDHVVQIVKSTHANVSISAEEMKEWTECLKDVMVECSVRDSLVSNIVRKLYLIYDSYVVDSLVDEITEEISENKSTSYANKLTPGVLQKVNKLFSFLKTTS